MCAMKETMEQDQQDGKIERLAIDEGTGQRDGM
jgi:hypothetical protein